MVERVDDRHARILRGRLLDTLDTLAKIRRVLIAGEDRDRTLLTHLGRELIHHGFTSLDVVDAIEGEAPRFWRVAVERHHWNTAPDGVVDRTRSPCRRRSRK